MSRIQTEAPRVDEPTADPQGEPGWARPAFLGFPGLVWLIALALTAMMVSYAFLVPIYRNADEHNHVDLVLHMRESISYPDFDEAKLSRQVGESMRAVRWRGSRPPSYGRSLADEAPPRASRPTFDQLAPDGPGGARNGVANHPFLYYLLIGKSLALVSTVWPGADQWHFDQVVAVMRLLSLLLVAPLPLLAFAAARRFGASTAQCLAAAVFPLINPQVVRQGASVNNDALLMLLGGVLAVLLVRVWNDDRSTRTAALVGVTLGLALLTKGFALALVPWVGLAYARAWWRGPQWPALVGGAFALGLAAVLGGWWWLRNFIVFGTVQTELENRWRQRVFDPDTVGWTKRFAGRVTASFWGFFGQFSIPVGRAVILTPIVLATAATVVGIAASLRARDRGRWTPAATPFLLWPMVGILLVLVPGAYRIYTESALSCCMHGRYLLPGVTALAVVVTVGWGWLLGRRQHLLTVGALVLGALLHGVAVLSVLELYWGPPNATIRESVNALLQWTPWRAQALTAVFAVCAFVVVFVVGRLVWASIRAGPDRR